LHRRLLVAALRHPGTSIETRLEIGYDIGGQILKDMLASISGGQLIQAADHSDTDKSVVQKICAELIVRAQQGYDTTFTPALQQHGYLMTALHRAYPGQVEEQHKTLVALLRIAYGNSFGEREFVEVLGNRAVMPTTALVTAAVSLFGQGARDVVVDLFLANVVERALFSASIKRDILTKLTTPGSGERSHQFTDALPQDARPAQFERDPGKVETLLEPVTRDPKFDRRVFGVDLVIFATIVIVAAGMILAGYYLLIRYP
jgi:hypothetical protein